MAECIVLTGPEALSYDDIAHFVFNLVARPVHHVDLPPEKVAG